MKRHKMLFFVILSVMVLCGLVVVVLTQPKWLFSTLNGKTRGVLYSVETSKPVIALTIDDGPDAKQTPKILEVLSQYDSHATFFLIASRVPGNEDVVQQILQSGNEIGNHMMMDEPSILLEQDEFERRLLEADETLSVFGETVWMRPGSGFYSTAMIEIADKHGYRIALGSIYPYDPQIGSAWVSANYVLWKARPGSIIVLHDYGKRGERTVEALEVILPELATRGYEVITLSELVE